MYIYNDETGVATINNIIEEKDKFVPNKALVPSYLTTENAVWLKADIRIETSEPVYLQIDFPNIDTIELFVVGNDGEIVGHKISGALVPMKNRELPGNYPKFQLQKGLYTYYIRAKSTFSLRLPVKILSLKKLYKSSLNENVWQGTYLGLAVLILLYSFFLLISLREVVYFFFSLQVIAIVLISMHTHGYTSLFLWPNLPEMNMYMPTILALSVTASLFAIYFLDTATKFKTLHKWLLLSIFLKVLFVPVDWLGYHRTAFLLILATYFFGGLLLTIAGFVAYKKGMKPARFYALACFIVFLGFIIKVAQQQGYLPQNFVFVNSVSLSSAIGLVLLLMALADRINILSTERREAKEAAYRRLTETDEMVRKQNALLSLKVEERTREINDQKGKLEDQKKQLEGLNATKDKIFSVIAHDLRGPLGNVSQLALMMAEDKNLRNEETIALLNDASKRSFDLLDSLLLWARAQFGESDFQKSQVNLRELSENIIKLYHLKIKAKDIKVTNKVPEMLMANADKEMIATVVRNLVSNALKFTLVGGEIEVGGKANTIDKEVSLWVRDSGLGIPPEKMAAIFEAGKNKSVMGTDGETGTGLGLVICKDFVEKNGGSISVESKLGKGTEFTITLPS